MNGQPLQPRYPSAAPSPPPRWPTVGAATSGTCWASGRLNMASAAGSACRKLTAKQPARLGCKHRRSDKPIKRTGRCMIDSPRPWARTRPGLSTCRTARSCGPAQPRQSPARCSRPQCAITGSPHTMRHGPAGKHTCVEPAPQSTPACAYCVPGRPAGRPGTQGCAILKAQTPDPRPHSQKTALPDSRSHLLLAVLLFFAVQVPASRWWLRQHERGPMEALSAWLTYGSSRVVESTLARR